MPQFRTQGYAADERRKSFISGGISGGATGAGIGTAIAPGIGTLIGLGAGAIIGSFGSYFLTDDEQNQLIEQYRSGKLDEAAIRNIEGTISRRYNILRRQQGADLSRRGISQSSFGARRIADTYNAERSALADAIASESGRRQALGFQVSSANEASRAQAVEGGIGALFSAYQLRNENQLAQQDMASGNKLAEAIGALFQKGGSSPTAPALTQNAPSIYKSQGGAGGVFSRQRTRSPNVAYPFLPTGKTLDEIFGRVR